MLLPRPAIGYAYFERKIFLVKWQKQMRYLALATDYDGTLACDGQVSSATLAALEKLRSTGRKLILVTGRELGELIRIFPAVNLFERVVAENGALLYEPRSEEHTSELQSLRHLVCRL